MIESITTAWIRFRNYLSSLSPLHIFRTRENVVLIHLYPKKRVIAVSYKGAVRKGVFDDNAIRNMMANNDFNKHAVEVLGAVGTLLEQLVVYKKQTSDMSEAPKMQFKRN